MAGAVEPAKFGKPLVFAPAAPDSAVIWLHGFGDKPEGWASAFKAMRIAGHPFSTCKWVHLRAPPVPQPCYGGKKLPGWGQFFGTQCLHPGDKDHENPDVEGFYESSVAAVNREIDLLVKDGILRERVVVGGFSQGAAISLEALASAKEPWGGCVALSGWLTPRARLSLKQKINNGIKLLLCHGTKDDMVGFDCAEAAAPTLREAGVPLQFEEYKGLAHSSDPEELRTLAAFLSKCLAPSVATPTIDWEAGQSDSDIEDSSEDKPNIVYVPKDALVKLRDELKDGQALDPNQVEALTELDELPDEEVMVPIFLDMIADIDDLVEKLGLKGAAEIFIQGSNAALQDTERHMSAKQCKEMQALGMEEGGEEEECEDSEEELAENSDEAPPAKRAKITE